MVKRFLRAVRNFMGQGSRTPARDRGGRRAPSRVPSPQPRPKPEPPRGRAADQDAVPTQRHTRGGTAEPIPDYPGDFTGRPPIEYAPVEGRLPDPGEVVWAWVPFEEDHSQGKERPVLLIGRDEPWLLGVPLTSKDHDRDADQEARAGRYWMDIGSGPWDTSGRPSEARLNRVVRVDPDRVRRRGVRLEKKIFDAVAGQIRQHTT